MAFLTPEAKARLKKYQNKVIAIGTFLGAVTAISAFGADMGLDKARPVLKGELMQMQADMQARQKQMLDLTQRNLFDTRRFAYRQSSKELRGIEAEINALQSARKPVPQALWQKKGDAEAQVNEDKELMDAAKPPASDNP